MKKILSIFLSLTIITSTMLGFSISAKADTSNITASIPVEYHQTAARSILPMLNAFRTGSETWAWNESTTIKVPYGNVGNLQYDYDLERIAMQRAAEIAMYYAHQRPNSKMFYSAYNTYAKCGENLAAGFTNAADVMEGWKETDCDYAGQGHRRNMLNKSFTTVGLACVYYNGTYYWVQEFRNPEVNTSTPTPAVEGIVNTDVEIADASVNGIDLKQNTNSLDMKCGSFTTVPYLFGKLQTTEGWPNALNPNVTITPNWNVSDTNVAEIIDNQIYAYKVGTTTLTAQALGTVYSATISVGVGDNGETEVAHVHKHEYTNAVTKAPTSKAAGVLTKTCACGDIITEPLEKLAKVSFKSAKPAKNSIKLSWKMIVSATGYQIQYTNDKKFKKKVKSYTTDSNTLNSLTIKKLKSKKNYYVRIRTYRTIEGKKYYSSWSKVKTIKTK